MSNHPGRNQTESAVLSIQMLYFQGILFQSFVRLDESYFLLGWPYY